MGRRIAALACVLVACSGEAPAPCTVSAVSPALYDASTKPAFLALAAGEARAVVRVWSTTEGEVSLSQSCTGILLAPDWVLTARHCVEGAGGGRTRVELSALPGGSSGIDAPEPRAHCQEERAVGGRVPEEPTSLDAARVEPHPTRDLALLQLVAPLEDVGPVPAAPRLEGRRPVSIGERVQLAGYGRSDQAGALLFKAQLVSRSGDHWVEVSPTAAGGACIGDSGGPLLVRDERGRTTLVAVLSVGSADCSGADRYERVDDDWVRTIVGQAANTGSVLSADCEALGDEGRCFGAVAISCADGGPVAAPCGEGCAGVSWFGECGTDGIRWCEQGRLRIEACGACGLDPVTGRWACQEET